MARVSKCRVCLGPLPGGIVAGYCPECKALMRRISRLFRPVRGRREVRVYSVSPDIRRAGG